MEKVKQNIFFENLDSLRFFAFFSVFICHTFTHYSNEIEFIASNYVVSSFIKLIGSGDKAVSFFFVLSGFLITFLILNEQKLTKKFVIKNFYMRRFLRIWPLYFLSILIGFVIYPALKLVLFNIETFQPHNWAYHISFLSNFDLVNLYNSDIGTDILMLVINWSLSVEEQFYIVWPLFFLLFNKKHYLKIFILVIIGTITYRWLNIENNIALKYNTFAVMGDLAIGGVIAYLAFFKNSFIKFFERMPKPIIIIAYLTGLSLITFENDIFNFEQYQIIKRLVWCGFFAFVILEQNYCKHSPFKLKKLKLISKWGKYTYGLYLLHPIAIQMVVIFQKSTNYTNPSIGFKLLFTLISFLLTLVLAYFSYNYFELFFLKIKKRFSSLKQA